MSLVTPLTPLTPRASSIARFAASCELTKPLSCTTPLKVSTLISVALVVGLSNMAAFTFVVMTLSSKYWPVPSFCEVDAKNSWGVKKLVGGQVLHCNIAFDFIARSKFLIVLLTVE